MESSKGFSRKGGYKPDITAPGVNVLGPSLGGGYSVRSGSSIAAAIVAGGAAQFLCWGLVKNNDIALKNANIKSYMIRGANRVSTMEYPNPDWGDCVKLVLG